MRGIAAEGIAEARRERIQFFLAPHSVVRWAPRAAFRVHSRRPKGRPELSDQAA